jgi:hypothetical protein
MMSREVAPPIITLAASLGFAASLRVPAGVGVVLAGASRVPEGVGVVLAGAAGALQRAS